MKKLLAIVLLFSVIGCNGQDKKTKKTKETAIQTEQNSPHSSWKVNKKYDDKGNLIRYDSTYTWTYSSGGKSQQVDADSVMASFRKEFNLEFPSFFNKSFGDPIWSDSLFYDDFTSPDYFMHKWEHHYFDMRSMMKKMDSMRNAFLRDKYPGLNKNEAKIHTPKD
jgi:hypothetical protein